MMVKYQVKYHQQENPLRRALAADSGYNSTYDEYPTENQSQVLYGGMTAAFILIGVQWFSHFFYWREFVRKLRSQENTIIFTWILHGIAMLFPAYTNWNLTR